MSFPTVLLIEDETAIADTILFALKTENLGGKWASSGREAMALLAEGGIDLIILDVGLPDCSGFDLCRDILSRYSIPIIFLTARADEVDRVVGLEMGADDYVVKPFSPRELTARVKAVLRRNSRSPAEADKPETKSGSPLKIDEKRRRVFFFEAPLKLSNTEFRILKVLAEHPGWVYSRNQLMDMVWDEPETSFDRTVDSHMKNLRAKLEAAKPGQNPIVTHRGQGYSLREDW